MLKPPSPDLLTVEDSGVCVGDCVCGCVCVDAVPLETIPVAVVEEEVEEEDVICDIDDPTLDENHPIFDVEVGALTTFITSGVNIISWRPASVDLSTHCTMVDPMSRNVYARQ